MWQAFSTTILFSLSAVCAQRSTRLLGGSEANFWRVWIAALLLGLWAHLFGQGLSGKALPIFFLSGLVGFGFGDVALYQALPRIGSRLSILLVHCVAAPFAALVEWLWLGTPLTLGEILAALTILAGVALALAPSDHINVGRGTLWAGVACAIVGALGQGGGAVLTRRAVEVAKAAGEQPVDGMTAAYQRIIGGVIVGTLFFLFVKWRQRQTTPSAPVVSGQLKRALPWTLANACAGPAVGVAMFQWALMLKPTGVILPIVALTPLVIIPFSRFVEGERPTWRSLAGGVVAVVGVVALKVMN
ncbi:MAG: DMT family transporter [Verrucomicrobia bacterium]|nr:DMT family transporter [Verrucomicrobiota bacterium]